MAFKKFESFLNAEFQHVVYVFAFVLHLQHLHFEAAALASLAFEVHIGQKLHLNHLFALAFAGFAPPAIHVKREMFGLKTPDLAELLVGKQVAHVIISLHIGHRIGTAALANGALVDKLYCGNLFDRPLKAVEQTGRFGRMVGQVLTQGWIQQIAYEGRLAGAAHAAHHGQGVQGNAHIYVFEVVLTGTADGQELLGWSPLRRCFDLFPTTQVLGGQAFRCLLLQVGIITGVHHVSAVHARFRPHINQVIGVSNHFFFVFHHHHGVAQVTEVFQHIYQAVCIARMQAHRWLVQQVHGGGKVASERAGEVNALRLATAEGTGNAVECEVTQPEIHHKTESVFYFQQQAFGHPAVVYRELQALKKAEQLVQWLRDQLRYISAIHAHAQGFGPQAPTVAGRTGGAAPIPRQHHPVLNFVGFAL